MDCPVSDRKKHVEKVTNVVDFTKEIDELPSYNFKSLNGDEAKLVLRRLRTRSATNTIPSHYRLMTHQYLVGQT